MRDIFLPGIDVLLTRHRDWLRGSRVGLVSHQAALDAHGLTSAERLWRDRGVRLVAMYGPEHGFFGVADAGEPTRSRRHPEWGIPIHSLYGRTRQPTAAMLRDVDALVFDLQDLGARPYTYVSTLRYVLEAAARHDLDVIVADRPVPLPGVVDGPVTRPEFASFVANIPGPMHYGMTPGETADWLCRALSLDVRLRVARMEGYCRQARRGPDWPPWAPPSPGIRSWESAQVYTATVAAEALPQLDHGRGSGLPFQLVGAPWLRGPDLRDALRSLRLPGVSFHTHLYMPTAGRWAGRQLNGVRIVVRDPAQFRPITVGVSILACIQQVAGANRLWRAAGVRPEFFDKLFATDVVRLALRDGESGREIARRWRGELRRFAADRDSALLYPGADA